jgi:hypothetical protein
VLSERLAQAPLATWLERVTRAGVGAVVLPRSEQVSV